MGAPAEQARGDRSRGPRRHEQQLLELQRRERPGAARDPGAAPRAARLVLAQGGSVTPPRSAGRSFGLAEGEGSSCASRAGWWAGIRRTSSRPGGLRPPGSQAGARGRWRR